jgi:hypothetical protein
LYADTAAEGGPVTVRTGRWRRAAPLVVWSLALLAGVTVFHALGAGPLAAPPLLEPSAWGRWAAGRDPLVATVAVLRLVVLALAWYLVGVTTVGLVGRLARAARLVRLADALTVPWVRRLLQQALGVGLATAMVGAASPLTATTPAPRPAAAAPASAEDGAEVRLTRASEVRLARADAAEVRLTRVEDTGDEVRLRRVGGEVAAADREHEVRAGESFWTVARDRLATELGRPPSDEEVVAAWQRLIAHNRDRLVDPDNPDLLFPGQRLLLPQDTAGEGSA